MSLLNNLKRLITSFYPSEIKKFKSPLKLDVKPLNAETLGRLDDIIMEHKRKEDPEIFSRGSDKRWYRLKSECPEFFDKIISESGIDSFIKKEHDNLTYLVMYNELEYSENNTGSGDGFHIDSTFFQRKLIYYLTKTTDENGCFSFIEESYNLNFIRNKIISRLPHRNLLRYSEREVTRYNIEDIEGERGDGFYISTNAIHRGTPLKANNRRAITFYLFSESRFPEQLKKYL
jgi:hypothetical protein